eukprot:CAMPEP_0171171532 /NCGR_PEP_ID=MMETSP0790-20130122/9264_1 /TAXON_ID=2925 /ORGANISM="Alexandrium catenella, Strain OF101" /LENGTH=281 /DNA_ID=CAMNT_0011636385 /DNA_START=67 /DNA_END=915 /DNA_ORIENTATION=-
MILVRLLVVVPALLSGMAVAASCELPGCMAVEASSLLARRSSHNGKHTGALGEDIGLAAATHEIVSTCIPYCALFSGTIAVKCKKTNCKGCSECVDYRRAQARAARIRIRRAAARAAATRRAAAAKAAAAATAAAATTTTPAATCLPLCNGYPGAAKCAISACSDCSDCTTGTSASTTVTATTSAASGTSCPTWCANLPLNVRCGTRVGGACGTCSECSSHSTTTTTTTTTTSTATTTQGAKCKGWCARLFAKLPTAMMCQGSFSHECSGCTECASLLATK